MNEREFALRLERNGIRTCPELPGKLALYFALLKEWNSRMDLIGEAEDEEMADRHFIDSLTVLKTCLIPQDARLIDIGTGAGFPGLILAMSRPDLKVTLLDAQQKRLNFLQSVIEESVTCNAELIHARAEDGARKKELRESFDVATARAVAPTNVLCEYLLPYVRVDGIALCWKGPALKDELEDGRRAAHILGGRIEMPVSCTVAGRDWEHMILPIRKVQGTPKQYPRKAGIPKQTPLR